MWSRCILLEALLLAVSAAQTMPNFFDDEQLGAILGTSFGVPGANATFDYVILGGGTAGLTIASRLAENKSLNVAVVEAGGFYEIDNGNLSVVPGSATFFTGADPSNFQPLVDWGFDTIPQLGAANRRIHYARGKTLGGSSARNYLVYHRATNESYKMWADQVGDQSYTFENLLPYYQKSCQYTSPNPAMYKNSTNSQNPAAFRPAGGPLQVSFSNFVDPFGTWARRGFNAVGMKQIDGLNSGGLLGAAFGTLTINPKNAHRSSSESSFLQNTLQNGTNNLIVYKNTMARRVTFDSSNTANGVLVTTAGTYGTPEKNYTLSARNEVIISAGVIQSPQLLMVSGVGPASLLKQFNIPIVKDLSGVGQNMWDHAIFGTAHKVNVLTASNSINHPSAAAEAAKAYLTNATGPLSIFGGGYYGWEKLPEPYRSALSSSARTNLSQFPSDWPELEWLPVSAYQGYAGNKQTTDPRDGSNYATLNTAIVSPTSRGSVSIQSADMTVAPLIDPAYLTTDTDIELAVQAFRRQRQVWTYLRENGLALGDEVLPGPSVQSDSQILEFISKSLIELYHAAATNKMGKVDDPMAVLDSKCRVYGTSGLRVVDASSFPFLPPGHPQSTVYMLAEKVADDILKGR